MTQNGGYTIEVDPDKLDELASGIGTAEMKCSFALSKLKWGMGSIAADIAGVGGGNINHLQEKFEGSIKKYKDLLDDSQAFVKKTAADVRQLDQSWQAKLGRTVGEFSGWYDLQRTFGEYDPQTGEKITGGQRAEAGVMTILNFSPGKAIGIFAKGGKMAKTAKIGQEASALGKIKSGRKAVNPAVFKDFFSGAWNSMKGRFRSAKEYVVKGKEAVKRVRENIGNVKVPVGVRVADTGMGARMIVPEKRSLKELGQQFAVKSEASGTKGTVNLNRKEAFKTAKDLAGVPRSQQPSRQWQVGDNINKKGVDYKNYEYSSNPTHHGRYYEYDTPQGKRVIVEHVNDGRLHAHAGKPKDGANPFKYDFKKERYSNIYGPNGDHHIYYNK
ncbi:HNH/endonuclease VII fold putative polymorphic toxin [Priestia endophytica]|uniref:HNH/endonuclease VII fold putative polymorphic toxin n=1 Tax=Priestia endophytica TaxID=135735 RepID=UPI00124DDA58|nr:HNH/endonuclease VII fold putative polymorphic toxin [Priestia endophytica]KAB2494524.1 hypothetical protein F8155_08095 [Priestia endophytica]